MKNADAVYVVYDNQCPFCRNYCQLLRLREATGNLILLDARQPSPLMDEITGKGINMDHGMVVKMGDEIYHGSDAMYILAMLSTGSDIFNRVMHGLFQSKKLAAIIYPMLRSCRNIILRLTRIPLIGNIKNVA